MKTETILAAAFVSALTFATTGARADDVNTRIGKLSFTHDFANGYPTKETVEKLYDENENEHANKVEITRRHAPARFLYRGGVNFGYFRSELPK